METIPESAIGEKRRFEINRCLGRGGFGEVYQATMVSPGGVTSDVAVKVLHSNLDPKSQAVQRLRDEGRLLGMLNHPNILRVNDLVVLEDRIAMVMEYVEGADLNKLFKGKDKIGLRALLEVIGQVADALHAAYYTVSPETGQPLGMVHRDIKPHNIRVGVHGGVKLLDFGVARAGEMRREAKTQSKAVVGSFLYMSPERLDDDGDLQPASDVYALGACLFEGLVRQRFYKDVAVKQQYFMAIDRAKYEAYFQQRLALLPDDLDPRISELVHRCLSYDPNERPTAKELSQACDRLAEEIGGVSLRRWCKERHWKLSMAKPGPLNGKSITEVTFVTSEAILKMTAPGAGERQASPFAFADSSSTAQPVPVREPARGGLNIGLVVLGLGLSVVGVALLAGVGMGAVALFMGPPAPADSETTVRTVPEPVEEPEPTEDTGRPTPPPAPVPTPEPEPVAPAPAPAPPPVARPRPVQPAPTPNPRPRPRPRPAPKPTASTGTLAVEGSVDIELHGGGSTYKAGSVPSGSYEVWAAFDGTFVKAGSVEIPANGTATVKCSALRRQCEVK